MAYILFMKKRKSLFRRIILKILTKVNTIGGAFIVVATIFGSGVGVGSYVSNIFNQIEINNINQKHNEESLQQDKEFKEAIDKYKDIISDQKHKNNMLEYNLNKLSHENKNK